MTEIAERVFENFNRSFSEFKQATILTKADKAHKLASQIDLLTRTNAGVDHLYEHSLELEEAGIFEHSSWNDLKKQVPTLVRGTMLSGHPNSTFEILSELRILAYALEKGKTDQMTAADAQSFLEEVLVHNLEFAFDELSEESRSKITPQERRKLVHHFQYLLKYARLDGIKKKLAEEMHMVCAQRPIVSDNVRGLIQTVYQKMELNPADPVDQDLLYFVNAIYYPGPLVSGNESIESYRRVIESADAATLEKEAEAIGRYLHETGLTNPYLSVFLLHAIEKSPDLVPKLLRLDANGISEWNRYQKYVSDLILDVFNQHHYLGIYGVKRMLEIHLFSRSAVRAGLTNLKLVNIDTHSEKRILKSVVNRSPEVSAKQYLLGALIAILGQPLGIGQGNNSTCQSARGISMWAQHSPGKLINMVITVATANNLILRFENDDLESLKLARGLVDQLDYKLDAISVLLVPHLDKVYNEMMRRAAGRGEDPHKWANPALYGHWVNNGFASAYSYLLNAIHDYSGFVRLFYSSFHPEFNGGKKMVYPNPVGIFVTSSKGDMIGFHAVSLLRVSNRNEQKQMRAYFLNPNNEGRQNWGQGIKPTVFGHGEQHGESSLPIHEFVARLYAFHYNTLDVRAHLAEVPEKEIERIEELALGSWGKSYQWNKTKKLW